MWTIYLASPIRWSWACHRRRLPRGWRNAWMKCGYMGAASKFYFYNLPVLAPNIGIDNKLRKIAWSRTGCIAYISLDGTRVSVRNLQCSPSDGKWMLSEESPLVPVTEAHGGNILVHLAWNEAGSELAVADCLGRVSIYSISMALNSITGLRQAAFDSSDDCNQVVGMMWLNSNRSVGLACVYMAFLTI